jgi:hypothetical protein
MSSIIFGIGTGALDAFLYDSQPVVIVLTAIVFGVAAGLLLSIVARLLFRSKKISFFGHISKALSLTSAGLILGIGTLIGLEILPHGQWEQIISSPEKPVRFLGQSAFNFWGGSIYIESENGNIYSYKCDSANPCSWTKEGTPPGTPEKNVWSCRAEYVGSHMTPLMLFKKVVDSYQVNICGADYTNQINFLLLDDGTIWVWNNFSSSIYDLMYALPVWLIVSSVAGFLSYIVWLIQTKQT